MSISTARGRAPRRPHLAWLALLSVPFLSCSAAPPICSADQDCGACERCADGSCVPDPDALSPAGICGPDLDAGADAAGDDSASPDAALTDLDTPDTAQADSPTLDTALTDSAAQDRASPDAALADATLPDSTLPDSTILDAAQADSLLPDAAVSDSASTDSARGDAGNLTAPCEPELLQCLDPAPPDVLEVPAEMDFQSAVESASAGQTIQVRGLGIGAGWWLPPYVTLRGCEGASIQGGIGFEGSGGTVEGFDVFGSGSITANREGVFTIRNNRFGDDQGDTEAPIWIISRESYLFHDVTAIVENNRFSGRERGIWVSTRYDNGVRTVSASIRNNVFDRVTYPVIADMSGLQNEMEVSIDHNTFHDFTDAIRLNGLSGIAATSANLFVSGGRAVAGSATFEAPYSFVWNVDNPSEIPPLGAAFAVGDPRLANPAAGDFRLGVGSLALDLVPQAVAMPGTDFFGCPRPVAVLGSTPLGDCGAIEAQVLP